MIEGDLSFFLQIGLPVVILMVAAWVVPMVWARIIGEGVAKLFIIAGASALVLWAGSGAYIWASDLGVLRLGQAIQASDGASVFWYILVQGARAAILWAPVMVLSVAAQPKRWKEAVW